MMPNGIIQSSKKHPLNEWDRLPSLLILKGKLWRYEKRLICDRILQRKPTIAMGISKAFATKGGCTLKINRVRDRVPRW
jgi:hypothetical protein